MSRRESMVKVKTSKIKCRASILRCKSWMKANRTMPTHVFIKTLYKKVNGHLNYYGMSCNVRQLKNFIDEVQSLIFKWLNRRSQRKSFIWDGFVLFMRKYPPPKLQGKIKHLWKMGAGASYLCE
ncbi:MAG: RNA-directed DNA polymerase (Reverse transcriptase) [uncultured bacterium]|nr:MAG: RNA-directed DNA polymerase (Reverse transcriptase) [uncultured bacterium]